MGIEITFESSLTIAFRTTSFSEMKREIKARREGLPLSLSDIVSELESSMTQKALAEKLGVSARFLRYVKTGKRLSAEPHKAKFHAKIKGVRSRLLNMAKKRGMLLGGGFNTGQIRVSSWLDFVCIDENGDVAVDIHEDFFSHYPRHISEIDNKGFRHILISELWESIRMMCEQKYECQELKIYHRGNKHPKQKICPECGKEFITINNKGVFYNVLMKKE